MILSASVTIAFIIHALAVEKLHYKSFRTHRLISLETNPESFYPIMFAGLFLAMMVLIVGIGTLYKGLKTETPE